MGIKFQKVPWNPSESEGRWMGVPRHRNSKRYMTDRDLKIKEFTMNPRKFEQGERINFQAGDDKKQHGI